MRKMKRYKYPRTYHFPFSPGRSSDDKIFDNFEPYFEGKQVVITEKMDGENTSVYRDMCHARSIDSAHRDYHSWLLNYVRTFQYLLNEDERVCGEYLFAKHSIYYEKLPSYFMIFSIWNGEQCLSWEDTIKKTKELGLITVPILYEGIYNKENLDKSIQEVSNRNGEGVVMRLASGYSYDEFNKSIIKYVRANHVQTGGHWSHQEIIKNGAYPNG